VHLSLLDPLPHQIQAVYGELLPRQPLKFALANPYPRQPPHPLVAMSVMRQPERV
jgi:hypothetical protein